MIFPKQASRFEKMVCSLLRAPFGHTGRPRRIFSDAHVTGKND